MARALLASTSLTDVLQKKSLSSIKVTDTIAKAFHLLAAENLLSVPVFDVRGEYAGCLSVNDLLAILAGALKAKDPHWLEKGGVFTAEDLKAIGHALTAKTVGDLEHSGGLWLVGTGVQASVLDVVNESFSIELQDPHHVHHRVYIASLAAAAAGHTATAGTTTVVSGTGSSLRVSHVLTHTDVVRLLWEKREALGELAAKTVEELELDAGAVFTVPASTPALVAFGQLAADQKSSLGLVDAAGTLVGNLSVSDLRGLSAEDFPSLLLPTTQYLASRTGAAPTQVLATVTTSSTLAQVLETVVSRRIHRVYVVDPENKPISIITLTDILRLAVRS